MTARTYLSIGDVLTLLREEFPDVTISKIRFLESQGLVNPERSPSGYRKFFETDVERLRWVLRQQREHFLPLKVIRDRLADGDLGEGEAAASESIGSESAGSESAESAESAESHGNGKVSEPAHAAAGARGAGSAGRSTGGGATGGGTATVTTEPPEQSQADDEAMARILADASRRSVRAPGGNAGPSFHAVPDPAAPASPTHLIPDPDAPPAPSPAVAGPLPTAAAPPVATAAAPESSAAGDTRSSGRAAAPVAPPPTAVARSTSTVRAPRHAPTAAGVTSPSSAPYPVPPGPGPAAEGHEDDAPALDDDVAAGSEMDSVVTAAAGRGTGGRESGTGAGTGRQGATAPRAAEPGAAAPRERGAAGAAGRQPGGQSAKNAVLEPGADADPGAQAEPGVHADPAAPVPPEAPVAPRAAAAAAGTPRAAATAPQTSGTVTGASLTAEELCAASGLSEAELTNLQGFGLIEPVMVAGIPTFDEDALTVANLAAAFRKFGIEARHLRPYRNAVDREVGLIEQVIIPLLRQRNPESRQRAAEAADELGALGQTMRATLMRAALRRHVGG